MVTPYLPDIIEGAVTGMNAHFTSLSTNPFPVYFDKGILGQVKKSVYVNNTFPLTWFVMKYDEIFGKPTIYCEANFQIIIATETSHEYTQQQREDINFKPKLLPMAERLIVEMVKTKWFLCPPGQSFNVVRTNLPYWGMGDVNGADQPNLFKEKYIDAVSLVFTGVKVKRKNC